jgi:hypothetical protein
MRAPTRERMIRIMAGAGLVAILSFSWLGQAAALAIQTNALIEEPLICVPGGLSATLPLPDYGRVARHPPVIGGDREWGNRGRCVTGNGLLRVPCGMQQDG